MGEGETGGEAETAPDLGGQTIEDGLTPPTAAERERRADFAAFVGVNLEKFQASPGVSRGWVRSICWPGFLFPIAWFMYRKMYGWAALACALPILAGVLDFGGFKRVLLSAPSLIGLFGRPIYAAGARRTIARVRASLSGRAEEEVRPILARAGGVSAAGATVGGAIAIVSTGAAFAIGFLAGLSARH